MLGIFVSELALELSNHTDPDRPLVARVSGHDQEISVLLYSNISTDQASASFIPIEHTFILALLVSA